MEMLFEYKKINLPAIVFEYINIFINKQDGQSALLYRILLNKVFSYFNIECGKVEANSVKQTCNFSTLEKNPCILRMSDRESKSVVFDLMDEQKILKEKIDIINALLVLGDAEIAVLKAAFAEGK